MLVVSEHDERPVIVAGAGIGGLTAALALHAVGVPVRVVERRQNRALELAGTGMTIWSNATTALGALGLAEQLHEIGVPIRRATHFNERGEVVFSTPVAELEWPESVPSMSVARGALVGMLLDTCLERDIPVDFGTAVTGFTDTGDEVRVGTAEHGELPARALLGADGARSALREQVIGGAARYYGVSVWRGLSEARDSIDDGLAHMFQTRRRSGLAGMAWRVGDGRVAWTIGILTPAGGKGAAGEQRAELLGMLDGVYGPARQWVEQTDDASFVRVDLHELPWQEQWGSGRFTLSGDAAHAMPTVLGQGACQAIEDGVELGRQFATHDEVTAALRSYEQIRLPRVRWVRTQVDRLAKAQQSTGPVALWLKEKAAKAIVPRVQKRMWGGLLKPPAPLPAARTPA